MKKLIGLALACALLLAGCAPRGGEGAGEELGDNSIRPLELTEEEEALLNLVGGTGTEYGVYQLAVGEGVTGCHIEVLSWEDGGWQATGGGSVAVSAPTEELRLGVVLEADGLRINWQDGSGQYSVNTSLGDVDRSNQNGVAWTWLGEAQALTVGERAPLYLEVYDDGDGVTSAGLPDSFFDVAYLNQNDRAYAVAITLEG